MPSVESVRSVWEILFLSINVGIIKMAALRVQSVDTRQLLMFWMECLVYLKVDVTVLFLKQNIPPRMSVLCSTTGSFRKCFILTSNNWYFHEVGNT